VFGIFYGRLGTVYLMLVSQSRENSGKDMDWSSDGEVMAQWTLASNVFAPMRTALFPQLIEQGC
jgi:hypothetical protein